MENPIELRMGAEACRRLAGRTRQGDAVRRLLQRANEYEARATVLEARQGDYWKQAA